MIIIKITKLKCVEQELCNTKNQLRAYEEKLKQMTQDANCREDQIIILRNEIQNLQDAIKIKAEEVRFLPY